MIEKIMPPNNVPVPMLAEETDNFGVTLHHWRKQAKAGDMVVPGDGKSPENWLPEDKFAVVLAMAPLNASELA